MKCPRCNGTGFVDWDDIERLGMQSHWEPGSCRYCQASGEVPEGEPLRRRVDAPHDVWLQNKGCFSIFLVIALGYFFVHSPLLK